jgi:hypothetical protein
MEIIQKIIDIFQSKSATISFKFISAERMNREKKIIPKNKYKQIFKTVFTVVP